LLSPAPGDNDKFYNAYNLTQTLMVTVSSVRSMTSVSRISEA